MLSLLRLQRFTAYQWHKKLVRGALPPPCVWLMRGAAAPVRLAQKGPPPVPSGLPCVRDAAPSTPKLDGRQQPGACRGMPRTANERGRLREACGSNRSGCPAARRNWFAPSPASPTPALGMPRHAPSDVAAIGFRGPGDSVPGAGVCRGGGRPPPLRRGAGRQRPPAIPEAEKEAGVRGGSARARAPKQEQLRPKRHAIMRPSHVACSSQELPCQRHHSCWPKDSSRRSAPSAPSLRLWASRTTSPTARS